MTNHLKDVLDAGKVAIGVQLRFGSAGIAEAFGHAGFDFVAIDGEHAPQTPVSMQTQFQGIGCTRATPIARLLKNDPDQIGLHLDLGAEGIVVPFVNSADDAAIGGRACRFPPAGTRGQGASRAAQFGYDPDYHLTSNDRILYLPIIETADAVNDIEQILAVDQVDSVFVGPGDLSISLGIPFQFDHPKLEDAFRRTVRAAEAAKKPAGCGVVGDVFETDTLKRYVDFGFRMLMAGGDQPVIKYGCDRILDAFAPMRT
jgi:4-hydroxy-2-oxoheptanedioate aldolase